MKNEILAITFLTAGLYNKQHFTSTLTHVIINSIQFNQLLNIGFSIERFWPTIPLYSDGLVQFVSSLPSVFGML